MQITFLDDNVILKQKVASFVTTWNENSDFFLTNTSGSTSQPKQISIKKKHAIQSARNTANKLNLKRGDKALLCLDLETIGGKMMLVRALVLDLDLYVITPSANPLKFVDEKIDFIALAPIQLHEVLRQNSDALGNIKNIIVGGGTISKSLETALFKKKMTVYQTFGMTETITHFALRKMGYETEEYFEILENVSISSEEGRLKIHAPMIGVEHLVTNDIVEIIDPLHFKWLGRADFVVNSGGVKLHPEMIQEKLESKVMVPFFLTGISDELLGEKLVIVYNSEEKDEYCSKDFYSGLSKYEIPKEAWFIDPFQFTASEKINRIETLKHVDESRIRKIL